MCQSWKTKYAISLFDVTLQHYATLYRITTEPTNSSQKSNVQQHLDKLSYQTLLDSATSIR